MTRPKIQNICDFCGKEIAIDSQEYTVQFSQKGTGKAFFKAYQGAKTTEQINSLMVTLVAGRTTILMVGT